MEHQQTYSPIRRFFKLMQPDRKDIYYIYLYAIFSGFITLSLPLGIQAIIGLIAGGSVSSSWGLLIFIVTAGTAMAGILKIMQLIVTETLQRRIFARASFDFAYRFPRFSLENTRNVHLPELANRFFDTLTIQKGLPKILMDFTEAILQIFFGLLVLVFYNSIFIFFGTFLLLIVFLIFYFTGPRGLETSLKESKYKYAVAHWLEELARTIGTFKLGGHSNLPLKKTDELVVNYLDSRRKHFKILTIQYGSLVVFKTFITLVLLLIGSILVIDNQINLGQFVAAEIIVLQIMNSVEKVIVTMDNVYDVLTALEKVGHVTDLPIEEEKGLNFSDCDKGLGMKVELKELNYQFKDADYQILKHINLLVKPGERVCITGYNGSGRSTLIKIIAGLFTEFKGQLSYNDMPSKSFNLSSLRAKIGDLSSKEDLFSGTVLENITLGRDDISLQEVIEAAKMVGIHDYIQGLSKGYQAMILPQGRTLSRSVRTKLILARNLACRPALLAIEDMMDHLESNDRQRIANVLTDKNKPWTLIAVSDDHFLASLCNRIIVMDRGEFIWEGTFEDMKKTEHFNKVLNA
jgi:ABC-type bacteriocin/lantibiotic exporter with double-glycine peptidase domain